MLAPGELPVPAPMLLAGWWGDKFNRLFLNPVTMPKLKSVDVSVDLLPERRVATIENAWTPSNEVEGRNRNPGQGFPAAVSRRAHRAIALPSKSQPACPRAKPRRMPRGSTTA